MPPDDSVYYPSIKAGNALVSQLKIFFESFDADTLEMLPEIYTQDVEFIDPVERIRGILALKTYFRRQAEGLNYCKFRYVGELVGQNRAYISWEMVFSHPKLAGGKELILPGMSEIHFTQKIYYQRDSYDLGAMLYEHLPLLGFAVRKLKQRLSHLA